MTREPVRWCHDCQIVVRSKACPKCGNADYGLWVYTEPDQEMPPEHWPTEPPAEGTHLPLYDEPETR